jgi:hypothetical protein
MVVSEVHGVVYWLATSIPHHLHITYKQFQPVYHTTYISPTNSFNQCTTPPTYHLQTVSTSIPHHLHITYKQFQPLYHTTYISPTNSFNQYTTPPIYHKQFQPVYHTTYISPTNSVNQYTTPPTYHLQTVLTSILPHRPHITYTPQYRSPHHHNITSPHHNITPHTLNNFNSPVLIIIILKLYLCYDIILTEIRIIFNFYVVMTEQTTFVSCIVILYWNIVLL